MRRSVATSPMKIGTTCLGGWHAIVSKMIASRACGVVEREIAVGTRFFAPFTGRLSPCSPFTTNRSGHRRHASLSDLVRTGLPRALSTGEWHFYERLGLGALAGSLLCTRR